MPGVREQEAVGLVFAGLDSLITLHQRKYEKLCAARDALLDKMFPKEGETEPELRFDGFSGPWERVKLSDLVTMHARIGWQNLRSSEFLDTGSYRLITGTDFNNGFVNWKTCHFVSKERYYQDPNIQVSNGSILITKDGTLGKVALVRDLDMPATLNAGVFNIRVRNNHTANSGYLYQYLKGPFLMDYVAQTATGGTIKHLNQSLLVDFPILLPSTEEQRLISSQLMSLDENINGENQKLDLLKQLRGVMLDKMFPKGAL